MTSKSLSEHAATLSDALFGIYSYLKIASGIVSVEFETRPTHARRLESTLEDLPDPVVGRGFTAIKALKLARAA